MTVVTRSATLYATKASKPSQRFGNINPVELQAAAAVGMFSVSLQGIPRNAVVTSAKLRVWQFEDVGSTATLAAIANAGAWDASVTWATMPALGATAATITKATSAAGDLWEFDATSQVQAIVSGTSTNFGWRIRVDSGAAVKVRGAKALIAAQRPRLVIDYQVPPPAPTGLAPSSDQVADEKPVLTFDADDDIIQCTVQISATPATVDWDSGSLAVTAGLVDLATTTYPGLADGAAKVWRVRQRTDAGWGPWSSWTNLSRTSKAVGSLISPVATVNDGTPPFEWSLSAGTQVAWLAELIDASGKVLATSGKTPGAGTTWTPPVGLTKDGQVGTARVTMWDSIPRTATANNPASIIVERAITLSLDGTVGPVDSLNAAQADQSPFVTLTGTRALGTPDEVAVFRDGVQIARYPGTTVFTGTNFTILDATAPMKTATTYRVAPVVNGKIASGGPTKTITPQCIGIWLIDGSAIGKRVLILTGEDQDQDQPEQSIEHVPISTDGDIEVVRRRMVRLPDQGHISGQIASAMGVIAANSESALLEFSENDAGHIYRLVLGRKNLRVIIGNIRFAEQPVDDISQRVLGASFDWWARA